MIRQSFRSLWSHKRRLISTSVAIVLGVAFMAGTLVLTSTINQIFDDLFASTNKNTDAVIRGPVQFKDQQQGTVRDKLPESLAAKVAALPFIDAVAPLKANMNMTLLDAKGDPMGGQGPPTFVGSWPEDRLLNAYQVVQGRAPTRDGEAVLDKAAAKEGDLQVGDRLVLIGPKGRATLKLVGITRFGSADSAGGSIFVGTTLEQAQAFAGDPDRVDQIDVRGDGSASPEEIVAQLKAAGLGKQLNIVTGRQAADETANEIKDAFGFFSTILLVFAGVALFVGMFIISNTFSILVAQRTKELALLRAIGASRRQVLTSVLAEAGVVGLVSAALGFAAGVGLAALAFAGLHAAGIDLPSAGLAITPQTALIAIAVGLAITALSALSPAIRATRVPPIAALRDVAVDNAGRSRARAIIGLLALALGAVSVIPAFKAEPLSKDLPGIGLGLAAILLAVLILGPVFARPLSRIVGTPLPLIKGVTGRIARENAIRSPRRTASTASALIIGVTLVGFITVFASSAQESVTASVSGGFEGDYIVQPASFNGQFVGLPEVATDKLAAVEGVRTIAPVLAVGGNAELPDGGNAGGAIAGVDPGEYGRVFNVSMKEGSFAELGPDEVIVDKTLAKNKGLEVGDRVTIVSTEAKKASYTVAGIGDDLAILSLYGFGFVTTDAGFAKLTPTPNAVVVGIDLKPGVSVESMRAKLKAPLKPYPTMKLQDNDQFTGSLVSQIKALLNVIYALLAVSIIIALIGIANTLSLSINERTRELGLLRAMGMTRGQLRSAVRWEAVIVALMGTTIGVVLGLGLSWIMVKGLASQGIDHFSAPVTGLGLEVLFGAGLGIVAAIRPAWKASKLNVLEAIAAE